MHQERLGPHPKFPTPSACPSAPVCPGSLQAASWHCTQGSAAWLVPQEVWAHFSPKNGAGAMDLLPSAGSEWGQRSPKVTQH